MRNWQLGVRLDRLTQVLDGLVPSLLRPIGHSQQKVCLGMIWLQFDGTLQMVDRFVHFSLGL